MPIFVGWQLYMQEAALIPPRLFVSSRNIALICTSAFFANGAFQCIIYWLPIWFQAVLGASPTSSGVRYLPTVISDVLTSLIAADLVNRLGWWNPFLIFGTAMVSLGGGLLSTLYPSISDGHWIGFQILGGVGYSLIVTMAHVGVQTSLPPDLVPFGATTLLFVISASCAIFLAVGEAVFHARLEQNLAHVISSSLAKHVIAAGASGVRSIVPADDLPVVISAYSSAVTQVLYLTAAAPVLSFVCVCCTRWISTKSPEAEEKSSAEEVNTGPYRSVWYASVISFLILRALAPRDDDGYPLSQAGFTRTQQTVRRNSVAKCIRDQHPLWLFALPQLHQANMDTRTNPILALEKCASPEGIIQYLGQLAQGDAPGLARFGSFTPSIYDSAWLSMVYKPNGDHLEWLFPQCFHYVPSLQGENGAWPAYVTCVDGILSTAAALLALLDRREHVPGTKEAEDLSPRIKQATAGLGSLLMAWDVTTSDQVGFEAIIPSLLQQILRFKIRFEFPGQVHLGRLSLLKRQRLCPEILYSRKQTTLLHSLEALVGDVDFDRVSHHCTVESGILGSPASTAAYLIHSSGWDVRGEAYLHRVVNTAGDRQGGVPSGYPTCIFEVSWALSTLLMSLGLPSADALAHLRPLGGCFESLLSHQNGLVGFAPGILPDADDTARVLMTVEFLGTETDSGAMVQGFRSATCFKTYDFERNPSFSANCNVLLALVSSSTAQHHVLEIRATVDYLLGLWRTDNVSDKWNISSHYSFMVLSAAFVRFLQRYDCGELREVGGPVVVRDVALCLCQILSRTLVQQLDDGSWERSLEVTSYCVLTISQMMHLPFDQTLREEELHSAIARGRRFIRDHQQDVVQPRRQDYVWIEKVSYSSGLLRKVYPIAALNACCEPFPCTRELSRFFHLSSAVTQLKPLLRTLPLFQEFPLVSCELALVEATLWTMRLHESRQAVFPPVQGRLDDILSLLVYQTDELMESVVVRLPSAMLESLGQQLKFECGLQADVGAVPHGANGVGSTGPGGLPGSPADSMSDGDSMSCSEEDQTPAQPFPSFNNIIGTLRKFIAHVLQHPKVLASSEFTQLELAGEVYNFLSAQLQHITDNRQFQQTHGVINATYHQWVQSTAADDTSCPMAALFFLCLTSKDGRVSFGANPQSRYLSRSIIRHLAVMCRQYNDYGSVMRDTNEGNLNSLHFPEFKSHTTDPGDAADPALAYPARAMKDHLLAIAEFERSCLQLGLGQLGRLESTSQRALAAFRVFVNVTDLYGQVYVQKDLTNPVLERSQ
ncbi:hypothetical protein BO78DRAFT_414321 [Aspergillus sclerotiicarbonarius CBS 121057]|uniref:Ent-kaurene synthase n=1 Tax=Aspergillus sclerotiicarbonarius (strain CBS 121057 / IBT 28362) TaxID=1448318 RepID=A0A319EZP1_ASPSB|nr:hypothetical protein BO78DRAFT_414321 [Aspergillus sclerotiicarbonarius CBS 121057]